MVYANPKLANARRNAQGRLINQQGQEVDEQGNVLLQNAQPQKTGSVSNIAQTINDRFSNVPSDISSRRNPGNPNVLLPSAEQQAQQAARQAEAENKAKELKLEPNANSLANFDLGASDLSGGRRAISPQTPNNPQIATQGSQSEISQEQLDLANQVGSVGGIGLSAEEQAAIKGQIKANPGYFDEAKAGLQGGGAALGALSVGTIFNGAAMQYAPTLALSGNPVGLAAAALGITTTAVSYMISRNKQIKENAIQGTKIQYGSYKTAYADIGNIISAVESGAMSPQVGLIAYNNAVARIVKAQQSMKYQDTIAPNTWSKNQEELQQIENFLGERKQFTDRAMQMAILQRQGTGFVLPDEFNYMAEGANDT